MIRRRVHAAILCGASLLLLTPSVSALSCLVIRPGRGLVSEKCPNNAVACRMRIENNAVVWYEYSKLYDRNHLACILKGEYSRLSAGDAGWHQDWCARKDRGTMRCWCAGNDCNEAPRIRRVYRAFLESEQGNKLFNEVPTASYRPTTTPVPVIATVQPATSPRPFFYTKIFAPPPTTINNFLHTNNYRQPKKNEAYWETTTMRAKSSISGVRQISDGPPDPNNEINYGTASTPYSLKIALISITAFTLFIVQIGYSI